MTVGELRVILEASTTKFTASLRAAGAQAAAFGMRLKGVGATAATNFLGSFRRLGNSITGIFTKVTHIVGGFTRFFRNVGLGIGAVLGVIIWQGAKFEDAMLRTWTIVGKGISRASEDFTLLRDKAIQLGRDTLYTATQAAQGMKVLALAGFNTTEILKTIPSVLESAIASGLEVNDVANIMIATLRSFQLETEKSANVSDILTQAFTNSAQTLSELGEALGYVAPIAAGAFGPTLDTVTKMTAAIMSLADAGLKGGRGGTQLRMMIQKLLRPTAEGMRILNAYGVSVLDASSAGGKLTVQIRDLDAEMGSLSKKIVDLQNKQFKLIKTGEKGSDEYKELDNSLSDLEDTMSKLSRQSELLRDEFTISGGTLRDFEDILDDMHKAGIDAASMARLLGVRAGGAGLILARSGYESFKSYVKLLKPLTEAEYKAGQLTERISQMLRTSVTGRIKDLGATIQISLVRVFEKFQERLADSIFDTRNFINRLVDLTNKKGIIEGFIDAIIKGLKPISSLFNEMGEGLLDWLEQLTPEDVEKFFTDVSNTIRTNFEELAKFLKGVDWETIFEGLKTVLGSLIELLEKVMSIVGELPKKYEPSKHGIPLPIPGMFIRKGKLEFGFGREEKRKEEQKEEEVAKDVSEKTKDAPAEKVVEAAEEAVESQELFYDSVLQGYTNLSGKALEYARKVAEMSRQKDDELINQINNINKKLSSPPRVGY